MWVAERTPHRIERRSSQFGTQPQTSLDQVRPDHVRPDHVSPDHVSPDRADFDGMSQAVDP